MARGTKAAEWQASQCFGGYVQLFKQDADAHPDADR